MDSILKCVLDSKDDAERGLLLDELSILKTLNALLFYLALDITNWRIFRAIVNADEADFTKS